jgi:hypothetical protein
MQNKLGIMEHIICSIEKEKKVEICSMETTPFTIHFVSFSVLWERVNLREFHTCYVAFYCLNLLIMLLLAPINFVLQNEEGDKEKLGTNK